MNFRTSRTVMWIGIILSLLIVSITLINENPIYIAIGGIIFIIAIVQAGLFYSCPNCHYSLMNIRGPVPDYCPKCGVCLKESDKNNIE